MDRDISFKETVSILITNARGSTPFIIHNPIITSDIKENGCKYTARAWWITAFCCLRKIFQKLSTVP
jgi:hypothetical protein